MSRKIKPYKKSKGTKKQQMELCFYNNFADDIAKHIITYPKPHYNQKNKI